ncbi:GntR family transcriptional regulator [Rothia kristinae]|uniref:GntR family transcriptional regulator n=1 Tax=Rothia kristinae TaxID=37923 RepID=A0A7T4MRT3_9MICC|nr:GntR family transcriptional regulator [Rothia kristinae]QQC58506.1 GntR family transcriptional regulator [Rothia kristinae]
MTAQTAPARPTGASAADLVYQHVKTRILEHELEGGELISEGEIAAELEVSRTPVREGFIRLQTEGWMTLYPKRGALIRQVGPHEIRDVVQARIMVESHAVRQIVAAREQEQVAAELAEILDRQDAARRAEDHDDFVATDAQFHQHLVASAANQLITTFYLSLADRQRRMSARAVWRDDRRSATVLAGHRNLLDAVRAGDPGAFETALTEHLTTVHERLLGAP